MSIIDNCLACENANCFNYLGLDIKLVRDYVAKAKIGKPGSGHLFRHAAAVLMPENGCNIRFIQQLLGHAETPLTLLVNRAVLQAGDHGSDRS